MRSTSVLSRLHTVNDLNEFDIQLKQCLETRAEALLLDHALDAPQQHLLLEMPSDLPIYVTQEGIYPDSQRVNICSTPPSDDAMEGWAPESALLELESWLERGCRRFIAPAAIAPVLRAILNIWSLDPYLARHYQAMLTPLLASASEADLQAIFTARHRADVPRSPWVESYMKLERKLYRAYLDH